MVLQPILDIAVPPSEEFIPAWNAVERQQTASAKAWWLITQPDHAVLSGEIAKNFSRDGFPAADLQVVRAIAMHDAGWELFESDPHKAPSLHPDGRPVSFFEVAPRDFLRAWTASIDRAQEESAAGGYMVSQHFTWLGEYRLRRVEDPAPVQAQLREFLTFENRRQTELKGTSRDAKGWDALLPLLQFCDLLSLYLCCGSRQPVEFPQDFPAGRVRAHFEADICVLTPSPFAAAFSVDFKARRYPPMSDKRQSGFSASEVLRRSLH